MRKLTLYVMRHGHSPTISEAGVATDAERPLSPRGKEAARKTARAILERGGKPALVMHSPLRRAVETAREAHGVLQPRTAPELFLPLSNVLPAEDLFKELRAPLERAGELLIVGHQPQLGELAALVGGQLFDLRPAGLVVLELEPGAKRAASVWPYQPD